MVKLYYIADYCQLGPRAAMMNWMQAILNDHFRECQREPHCVHRHVQNSDRICYTDRVFGDQLS